jgi:ubiquinol-cytochrome c reductase iron-sulfur subunit
LSPQEPDRVRRFARVVAALVAVRALSRRGSPDPPAPEDEDPPVRPDEDPSERTVPANRRAETAVAGLLVLAALFGFGFTAIYVVASLNTQLLGLAIGGMLALLAAAAILAGKMVVPQETAVEERDVLLREEKVEEIVEMVEGGGEGVSRRVLLAGAGGLAGVAALTAAATPLASLGPRLTSIHATPWKRGVRFLDEESQPYLASEIEIGSFYTALPEGADWEQLGAPLLVVKLPAHYIHLPPQRRSWAPQGILAYSKICPHAACAISLYRYPTFGPTSGVRPAFTCPCHYSTFLPGESGRLIFGPAGRALPQLPVMIDDAGYLRAGGEFDEDVGPSWFDVHRPQA